MGAGILLILLHNDMSRDTVNIDTSNSPARRSVLAKPKRVKLAKTSNTGYQPSRPVSPTILALKSVNPRLRGELGTDPQPGTLLLQAHPRRYIKNL